MSLPSYQEATTRLDPWIIIASLLPIDLLSRLCLVSRHFYEVFAPLLWFQPTKLLLKGTNPLDSYGKFVRRVGGSRQSVRGYVTILDFRPLRNVLVSQYHEDGSLLSHPPFSGTAFSRWFQFLAASFPSLKFIIADGLMESNLDGIHSIEIETDTHLIASGKTSIGLEKLQLGQARGDIDHSNGITEMAPKNLESVRMSPQPIMLSLAGCTQVDTAIIFDHSKTTNVLYLDISWTRVGPSSLSQLANFPHLKVLKLRGLRLKTQHLSLVLKKLKTQIFSLDIRNNALNDDVIEVLLKYNFRPRFPQPVNICDEPGRQDGHSRSRPLSSQLEGVERYLEDAPAYRERAEVTEEQETVVTDGRIDLRPDDLDGTLSHFLGYEQLKSIQSIHGLPLDGDSFMQHTGITHLFLSDNQFSSDAMRELLLGTNRLQVLDFGSGPQSRHHFAAKNLNIRPVSQPDTVKFLKLSHSQRLESLRVHHSVVTHTPTLSTIGEFHLSEPRRVQMSEEQYAIKEMTLSPLKLLPDTSPRIKSLTLTNVPQKSFGRVIERLLHFLHEASIQESMIARAAPADSRRGAQMLTGLRLLRLEFEQARKSRTQSTSGPSISGNPDADIFMAESNKDFSFFDDASGDGAREDDITVEKDFSFFKDEGPTKAVVSSPVEDKRGDWGSLPLRDVRAEIFAYRSKTKEAFEREKERLGGEGVHVPLGAPHYYWTGRLELVS